MGVRLHTRLLSKLKGRRRFDVEGRTCCLSCQQIVANGGKALKHHVRVKHPWLFRTVRKEKPKTLVQRMTMQEREAYFDAIVASMHYAPDGSYVAAMRECVTLNGTPKLAFGSEEEALGKALKQEESMKRKFHAYQCSNGHWHIARTMA